MYNYTNIMFLHFLPTFWKRRVMGWSYFAYALSDVANLKKVVIFFGTVDIFLQRQSCMFFFIFVRLSFSLPESTKAILSTLGCRFPSRNFLFWMSKHFRRSKYSSWTTTWSTFQTSTRFNWQWTKKFWSHSSGTSMSSFNLSTLCRIWKTCFRSFCFIKYLILMHNDMLQKLILFSM